MRSEWVPLSASALVIGVMALLLGSVLNPTQGADSLAQALHVVDREGGQWLAVAVLYFGSSIAMTLGLPTLLSLLAHRGRTLGYFGVGVFSVGVIGLAGYAMLMVFLHALVTTDALRTGKLDEVIGERGFGVFLYGWLVGFLLGVLLIALALLRARTTARWVPLLLLVFVVLLPFSSMLGRVGSALDVLCLVVAFTGVAMAATSPEDRSSYGRRARLAD
jgi:MFS family permease